MVLGVVLGMTLILASWGMLDTMLLAVDRQFTEVQREDAQLVLDTTGRRRQVATIEAVDGVEFAEPVIGLQATVAHEGETFGTLLEGYRSTPRSTGSRRR